jgi:hypothetical protein
LHALAHDPEKHAVGLDPMGGNQFSEKIMLQDDGVAIRSKCSLGYTTVLRRDKPAADRVSRRSVAAARWHDPAESEEARHVGRPVESEWP